jgi:hypothetical protein
MSEAWPPDWILDLERAHAEALRAARALEAIDEPSIDLGPAVEALVEAFVEIYAAYDAFGDPHRAAHAAGTALRAALDRLVDEPSLADARYAIARARQALGDAERRAAALFVREPPPPTPLRASVDRPTLHVLARRPIAPVIRVAAPRPPPPDLPPPLPPPTSLAELAELVAVIKARAAKAKAEPPTATATEPRASPDLLPGFAAEIPPARSPLEWIGSKARECFEEVAMIGTQRMPLLGDPFRSVQFLEHRMLRAFDAIAALGAAAVARLEGFVVGAPIRDPSRAFAAAFVFGGIEGRDVLGAAERIFRFLGPGDREIAAAFRDGLRLAPNPLLPLVLRTWLADADPALRSVAIEVLGGRGLATFGELAAAVQDPSPHVAAVALPHLASCHPHEGREALERALERALATDDTMLHEAAWHAMTLVGHPLLVPILARALDEPVRRERAAIPYAIVAEETDAARLLEHAAAHPSESSLLAVGWAGAATRSIPFLIGVLASSKEAAHKIAAANALDRLTGAGMYETVAVPPEAIVVEEPPVPEVEVDPKPAPKPLAQVVSDPRDLPSDGAADAMELPTTDPDRWRAYFREFAARYTPRGRHRRGQPYTPWISWWELDQWRATPFERRMLQRELVARTGQLVPFDPVDLVVDQELAMQRWEPHARAASGHPAQWSRAARR